MSLPDQWGGPPTESAPDPDPDSPVSREVEDGDDEQQTISASQRPRASFEAGPGPSGGLRHQSSNLIDFDDGHYHDHAPSGSSGLVSQSSSLDRASIEAGPASDDGQDDASPSYSRTPFGSALVDVEKQNEALGSTNRDLDEASDATSSDQLPDYNRTGPSPPPYTSYDITIPTRAHSYGSPAPSLPYRPTARASTGWFTGRLGPRLPGAYIMASTLRPVSVGDSLLRPISMRGELVRDGPESMRDVSTRGESMTAEFIRGEPTRDESMRDESTRGVTITIRDESARDEFMRGPTMRDESTRDELVRGPSMRDESTRDELVRGPSMRDESTRDELVRGPSMRDESTRDEFIRAVIMRDEHTRGESVPMNDLAPLDQRHGHYPNMHSDQHSDSHSASMADEQLQQWEQTHEEQSLRDEESTQTHRATADSESRYRYDIEANENRRFGARLHGWFTSGSRLPVQREKLRKACRLNLFVIFFFVFISLIAGGLISRHDPHRAVTEVWNPIPGITPPELPVGLVAMRPFDGPEKLTTCVSRPYQWSCALPPDTTYPTTTALNDGARVPFFRFAIEQRNRTDHSQPASRWDPLPSGVPDTADYLSLASLDAPPDRMGNPKYPEGEETDYYISLVDYVPKYTQPLPRVHPKRDNMRNPSSMIPHTLIKQPVRLFDRGLWTEHYAFTMYFDKTIQFSNDTKLPGNTPDLGGASGADGRYKIVWHNTRFRVQMFTSERKRPILRTSPDAKDKIKLEYEFERPMEIWEDRAGGDEAGRTVTATIVDENGMIVRRVGIPEKRGIGTEDRGCYCRWRNFYDMT